MKTNSSFIKILASTPNGNAFISLAGRVYIIYNITLQELNNLAIFGGKYFHAFIQPNYVIQGFGN